VESSYQDQNFDLEEQDLLKEDPNGEPVWLNTTKHDPWFNEENIDPEQVQFDAEYSMPNFQEYYVGEYMAKK